MNEKEQKAAEVLNLPKLTRGQKRPSLKDLQILWALFCAMAKSSEPCHELKIYELDRLGKIYQIKLTEKTVRKLVDKLKFIKVNPIITSTKSDNKARKNLGIGSPIEDTLKGIYEYVTIAYSEETWKVPGKYQDIIQHEEILRPTEPEPKAVPVEPEKEIKVEEVKKEEKSLSELIPSASQNEFGRKQFAVAIFLEEYGPRSLDQISEFLSRNTWYRYLDLGRSELTNFPEIFEQLPGGKFKLRVKLSDLPYNPKAIIKEAWYIEEGSKKIELINEFFPAEADWNPNIVFILRDDTISSRTELGRLLDQLGENDYPIGKHALVNEIKEAGILDSILLNAEKNL